MTDWTNSSALIEKIATDWATARTQAQELTPDLDAALEYNIAAYDDSDLWWAQRYIILSLQHIENIFSYLLSYHWFYEPHIATIYYLKHHTGGAVTWKAICEAWIKDDFEGRGVTIACIDRMRQILWDEPFNVKWAARPTVPE